SSAITRSSLLCFVTPPATSDISPLSLHDALPIYRARNGTDGDQQRVRRSDGEAGGCYEIMALGARYQKAAAEHAGGRAEDVGGEDRKSTRLNSSHQIISYAVFCLKKKKNTKKHKP